MSRLERPAGLPSQPNRSDPISVIQAEEGSRIGNNSSRVGSRSNGHDIVREVGPSLPKPSIGLLSSQVI